MMEGKIRHYTWHDIQRLIMKDCGLQTEEEMRTRGELWYKGGFRSPDKPNDTCVSVEIYSEPFSTRIKRHAGE